METPENHIHTSTTCNKHLSAVSDALYVIGGKWNLKIIIALSDGPARFNDLQRRITGISARVLSNELKEMEMNGFVARTVFADGPVIVEYSLTPYSETVKPIITALSDWGIKHREKIMNESRQANLS
ncbi:MAG: transcriptional regulator [Chitinophagaceae bacterium]|nr:MAG: transcriptional regulator [Chitinophagaceae bacterium]